MGNACFSGERMLHQWRIQGFSNLLNHGEGDVSSGFFEAGGYNWFLHMMTAKREDGNMYVSVRLCAKAIPSDLKVKAKYSIVIFDQKHGKHIKETGASEFTSMSCAGVFHYMTPLAMLKESSSGFLENDSCIFGVEILEVVHTSTCKMVSDCTSLYEGRINTDVYTWKINRLKLQGPLGFSKAFDAGGLKWSILVHPHIGEDNKYLSISLELDYFDAIRLEFGVPVEFAFCVKDQVKGKHKELIANATFSANMRSSGWPKFLSYKDLYDPSKGFLLDNTCIIKASVAVLGSLKVQVEPSNKLSQHNSDG